MDSTYIITRMQQHEISLAIEWAAREGWNPGIYDASCFYQTDPQGFFAGRLNNKIIAMGSAVIYDDQFAFCGFYMVDKPYRGQGYGLALTKARLAYIGQRNAGIDGVTSMLSNYAKIGYKLAHNNARYSCQTNNNLFSSDPAIINLNTIHFDLVTEYDRMHFPAPRSAFLSCWINQPGSKSIGYLINNQLHGYGVIRPCHHGYKIGPLFADTPKIANELFKDLASHAQGKEFYLDIPVPNKQAQALVKRYHMKQVFETARMYLKTPPTIDLDSIYGITSYELG